MNARNLAMWLGIAGVVTGVIGVAAAALGDDRLGTVLIGQSRDLAFEMWVVSLGIIVLGIGAIVTPYRPLWGAGLMALGVLAALVGSWNEISRWTVDLWTLATGGIVAYVDEQGLSRMPSFGDVLAAGVSMPAYAITAILGTIATIIAAFAPQQEAAALRPATRPTAA